MVYYLYHHHSLIEYAVTSVGDAMEVRRDCGNANVRGDGTPERFGKDSSIFLLFTELFIITFCFILSQVISD